MGVNVSAGRSVDEGTIWAETPFVADVRSVAFATAAGCPLLPVCRFAIATCCFAVKEGQILRTTDKRIKSTDGRMAFAMHAYCRRALLHMALAHADGFAKKSEQLAAGGLVRTQSAGARLTGVGARTG
jgi:hypothetical protein